MYNQPVPESLLLRPRFGRRIALLMDVMLPPRLSLPAFMFVVVSALAAPAHAASPDLKVDRGLSESLTHGAPTQPVIISVADGCRDFVRQSLVKHGDRIKSEHPIINALAVELHSEDVAELATHNCVKTLSLDAPVSAKAVTDSTPTALNPLRETLGLPSLPNTGTPTGATGVAVAVVDSGIAPTDDFGGRIVGFYDFTHGGVPVAPYDDYGHRTHVAGLIGTTRGPSGSC